MTTTESSRQGRVVRFYNPTLKAYVYTAYNDMDREIGTFWRERAAWDALEAAWARPTLRPYYGD